MEVAHISQEIISRHTKLAASIPLDKQVSWLQLADTKRSVLDQLTTQELAIQAPLIKWETSDVLTLQTSLVQYRKSVLDMQEVRKGFTKYMDMITAELMQPEKRAAAWEVLEKAEARRVELLKAKAKEESDSKAKIQELANFQAHVRNEYSRMAGTYRQLLSAAIGEYYKNALAMDLEPDGLVEHLRVSALALADIQVPPATKYAYTLHTREEIIPHAQAIPQPNYLGIVQEAQTKLQEQFSMYANDRPRKQEAIIYLEAEMVQESQVIAKEVESAIAVNTLVAQSAAFQVQANDGVKALKVREVIVVKDDDFGWAHRIITVYLSNWYKCLPMLTVKKAGNLTVAQMATALDKAEIKVDGVEYKKHES